MLNNFIFSLF